MKSPCSHSVLARLLTWAAIKMWSTPKAPSAILDARSLNRREAARSPRSATTLASLRKHDAMPGWSEAEDGWR